MKPNGYDSGASFSEEARALARMSNEELRETWQYKIFYETKGKSKENGVFVALIGRLYPDVLDRLLAASRLALEYPICIGHGKIAPAGQLVCDMMKNDALRLRNVLIYDSEDEMIGKFRRLADKLKLSDFERMMMFRALKAWVSQDRRVNHEGERAA